MKRKLLFVNGHLNVGGIEKSLSDLLSHLDYSRYEVDLLLLEDKGTYTKELPSEVHLIHHDTRKAFGPFLHILTKSLKERDFGTLLFRLVFLLSPILGKRSYRLLRHSLGITKSYDMAIAYRVGFPSEIVAWTVKSKQKACWWHNGDYRYSVSQTKALAESWKKMNHIVSVSEGCKQMLMEKVHLEESKVKVIPNIIDIEKMEVMAGSESPYPKEEGIIHIVTLGRLCWEKHMEDIPVIARKLLDKGIIHFRWHIIGDGAKREEIAKRIKENHMERHVIMHGHQSNPYPYLKHADMMVHTSYVEAHCLTMLEAMALKTPCVVTKTVIPQDFTIEGENCYIAEQDINSQAACIEKMLNNQDKVHGMVDKAYLMVKEHYSANTIVKLADRLFQ
ncbi:MAG: glycosyltransferase [Prevotella sp.]|nr:glycosyltransferase [Prevotella sp.]